MPQKVVIRTAAFFAAILALAQFCMLAYYALSGSAVPVQQPVLVGILASIVVLPVICHSVLHAERNRAMMEQLNGLAQTDALTGVFNRTGFRAAVERVMERLKPGESAGAFLYVDADHFKSINDRFGHHVGDHALSIIGGTLRAKTRESDICGRLGGEEFGVLLLGANFEQARFIAERIRTGIEENGQSIDQPGLRLTVSIGMAVHEAGQSLGDCMQAADKRLYEAKHNGRNRVEAHLELVKSN